MTSLATIAGHDARAALLAEVGRIVTASRPPRETLQQCAEAIVKHLDAAFARVWTLDHDLQVLELQASAGLYTHLDGAHGRVPVGRLKIGRIAREGKPHLTNRVVGDPQISDQEWAKREGMVAFAGYPLMVEGRVEGVLALFSKNLLPDSTLDTLAILCHAVALGISRERAAESLRSRERALRDARTALEIASTAARIGFWEWDAKTGEKRYSESWRTLFHWPEARLDGSQDAWIAIVHPEDRERVAGSVSAALRAPGAPYEVTLRLRDGDGGDHWVLSRGKVLCDAAGTPERMLGVHIDISERKLAEDRLRETGAFLEGVLENIPDMVFVKTADDLRFVHFNRAGEELLGYSRDDLLGKTDYDVFPPAEADFFTGKDREVLARGQVVDVSEEPIPTGRGERVLNTKKIPISDAAGRPRFLLGISRDVTEAKQLERRVLDSERARRRAAEERAAVLDALPVQVAVLGADGTVLGVNAAWRRFGLAEGLTDPDACVGDNYLSACDRAGKEGEEAARGVRSVLGGRQDRFAMEYACPSPNEQRWFRMDVVPLEHGVIVMHIDLTQRMLAEQALRFANQEMEAFSYSVSHDLRAPLRAIDGFSRALLEDQSARLDADAVRCVERIRAASLRMGQLIDDLLKLSRVQRSALRRGRVDLSSLARTIAEDLRQSAPERAVQWVIADDVWANGDEGLLRVVLENLLANAWKYTSKHAAARIELGVTEHDGQTAYFVRDDGAGFDMAYADKLFGPFQRFHGTREFEGTGIGLAIVQRIVHRHGGKIWAEAAVERGAIFSFTLPYGSNGQRMDGGSGQRGQKPADLTPPDAGARPCRGRP